MSRTKASDTQEWQSFRPNGNMNAVHRLTTVTSASGSLPSLVLSKQRLALLGPGSPTPLPSVLESLGLGVTPQFLQILAPGIVKIGKGPWSGNPPSPFPVQTPVLVSLTPSLKQKGLQQPVRSARLLAGPVSKAHQ